MPPFGNPEKQLSKSPSPKAESEFEEDIEDFHSVVDSEADTIISTPTATPPPPVMSTIKPPKPAVFTGDVRSSEVVDMFFHQLGVFLRLSKVAEEDKTDVASMFLQGRAYRWFMTKQASPEAANTIAKFADFERELRIFFIPPDEQAVLTKRFYTATQGRSSVADFALELRTLADKLGDIPERILKYQFTEGLRVNIQAPLAGYTTKADTWGELVENALKAEDVANKVSAAARSRYSQPANSYQLPQTVMNV